MGLEADWIVGRVDSRLPEANAKRAPHARNIDSRLRGQSPADPECISLDQSRVLTCIHCQTLQELHPSHSAA